jgi:hypothetical protein
MARTFYKNALVVGEAKPPKILLVGPQVLLDWEVAVEKTAEIFFHSGWAQTSRVGGKLFEEIRSKNPQNVDVLRQLRDAASAKAAGATRPEILTSLVSTKRKKSLRVLLLLLLRLRRLHLPFSLLP